MKQTRLVLIAVTFVFGLSACATDEFGNRRPLTDLQKGALIGTASGAALGALASKNNRGKGALIGAIGGGLAGGLVGNYMDKQNQDLLRILSDEINAGEIEVSSLPGDALRVTMTGQTAFDTNSSQIKPGFTSSLDKLASVINRYGKTTLVIIGHTDNVGSNSSNQTLSEDRALSVEQYFTQSAVHPSRISSYGRGESEPRATNDTESGKRLNRRVEIIVEPVIAEQG